MSFFNYFDLQITKHFGRILFIFVPENATKSNKKTTKSPKFLIFKTYEEIMTNFRFRFLRGGGNFTICNLIISGFIIVSLTCC